MVVKSSKVNPTRSASWLKGGMTRHTLITTHVRKVGIIVAVEYASDGDNDL